MPSAATITSASAMAPLAKVTRPRLADLLETGAPMAGVDHALGQRLRQEPDEVGAVHAECGVPAGRIRYLDRRDRASVLTKILRVRTNAGAPFLDRRLEADPLHLADAVGRQENARADLAELRRLLVDLRPAILGRSAPSRRKDHQFRLRQ